MMHTMTSDQGPDRRALLAGRAGELYRDVITAGVLELDDPRLDDGHPDHLPLTLLIELGLLQTMRFDAKLPDGSTFTVDGFLAVDEKKFAELPPAALADLHKTGVLGLVYAHQFSLRLMRVLVDKRLARTRTA